MNKQVVILRGPSGSGKTTFAKREFPYDSVIVSADSYFLKKWRPGSSHLIIREGRASYLYAFDPRLLPQAHADCLARFLNLLKMGKETVVVDNTNTHVWEFEHYKKAAILVGYSVRIVSFRLTTVEQIKQCARRNEHGVPIDVIAKHAYEYEPYPGEEYIKIEIDEE